MLEERLLIGSTIADIPTLIPLLKNFKLVKLQLMLIMNGILDLEATIHRNSSVAAYSVYKKHFNIDINKQIDRK